MRVLIVTGSFPPAQCGVGEYSFYLAEALAARNAKGLGILTSRGGGEEDRRIPGVEILRVVPSWKIAQIAPTLRAIAAFKPDVVHIQYPTRGYDGGLAKVLPAFLRLRGIPVVQTWHEHFSECGSVGWPNLLACDALIHVRPDLPSKLPGWVRVALGRTPIRFIRSASTIPAVALDPAHLLRVKRELSPERPIVCFFGFANPNKGVERLFEIADPKRHRLVLLSALDPANPYHASLLRRTHEAPWAGQVTVTGFQTAARVAECLAAADAVVFPFVSGAGEWNTSLQAAEASGVFSLATTDDESRYGYDAERNVCLCGPQQIPEMRDALARYLGRRVPARTRSSWDEIAAAHEEVYRLVAPEAPTP